MTGTLASLSFEIIPTTSSEQCYRAKHAIWDLIALFCVKGERVGEKASEFLKSDV